MGDEDYCMGGWVGGWVGGWDGQETYQKHVKLFAKGRVPHPRGTKAIHVEAVGGAEGRVFVAYVMRHERGESPSQ